MLCPALIANLSDGMFVFQLVRKVTQLAFVFINVHIASLKTTRKGRKNVKAKERPMDHIAQLRKQFKSINT